MGIERLVIEKGVWVVILNLLMYFAIDLLQHVLTKFGWYLKVLDKGLGEQYWVGDAVVEIPRKSVSKLESIQFNVQPHRYELLNLLGLQGSLLSGDF